MSKLTVERKGPHKSMHCKFCRPPDPLLPEKLSQSHLETTTKLRVAHEAVDLRLVNVDEEPGVPAPDSAVCICQLENENTCLKCAPDKKRKPVSKKVCDCPQGAKPHPDMLYPPGSSRKRISRQESDDDEFWWEKEERRRAAIYADKWAEFAAQMAERKRRERKLYIASLWRVRELQSPKWYQILSCQQVAYIEFLATAIRLDSDENVTDRTSFVLTGIGLFPRPTKQMLKKCLRACNYNALTFLDELLQLSKLQDPFRERFIQKCIPTKVRNSYWWNERLIKTVMCHLELPQILRELMDRLPKLPWEPILPPLPYPTYPVRRVPKNTSPYMTPLWQDTMPWTEKDRIDRINRYRAYMDKKRIAIPEMALVRRPSLIDARPPFLAQIEANERAAKMRQPREPVKKRIPRKKPVATFDSDIDVTAIAAIEPSEVSSAKSGNDGENVCQFLRTPAKPESLSEDEVPLKDIMYPGEMHGESSEDIEPEPSKSLVPSVENEPSVTKSEPISEESMGSDHMPFATPPKTESGRTIAEPCPAPISTPSPAGKYFEQIKQQLDIINEEICCFNPSADTPQEAEPPVEEIDVTEQLKKAAKKLKELHELQGGAEGKKKRKKKKKEWRCEICKNKCTCQKKTKPPQPKKCDKLKTKNKEATIAKEEGPETKQQKPESPKNKKKKKILQKSKAVAKKSKKKMAPLQVDDAGAELGRNLISFPKPPENENFREENAEANQETTEQCQETPETRIFYGEVTPFVKEILADLKEEGFYSPGFKRLELHPDIQHLLRYLRGEILSKEKQDEMWNDTVIDWLCLQRLSFYKAHPPKMPIRIKRQLHCDWNDKRWIESKISKVKEQFYFNVAKKRALCGKDFYPSLCFNYFGPKNAREVYFSYFVSRYQDNILKGLAVAF